MSLHDLLNIEAERSGLSVDDQVSAVQEELPILDLDYVEKLASDIDSLLESTVPVEDSAVRDDVRQLLLDKVAQLKGSTEPESHEPEDDKLREDVLGKLAQVIPELGVKEEASTQDPAVKSSLEAWVTAVTEQNKIASSPTSTRRILDLVKGGTG